MTMVRNMSANNIIDEQIQSELYNLVFRIMQCFIPNKRLILFRTKHIILSKSLFGGAFMAGIMTVKEAAKHGMSLNAESVFFARKDAFPEHIKKDDAGLSRMTPKSLWISAGRISGLLLP